MASDFGNAVCTDECGSLVKPPLPVISEIIVLDNDIIGAFGEEASTQGAMHRFFAVHAVMDDKASGEWSFLHTTKVFGSTGKIHLGR